ncbi:MAG: HAD-IC family P-type ATPase, partial [Candidatus Micrarchaeota archaeon]
MADWHARSHADVLKELESSEKGLTGGQVRERLVKYGRNELKEGKKKGPLRMFLEQFTDFLVLLLIAAALISGFLGELLDAGVILAVVLLNAIFGFMQQYNAERAIAALKKMVSPKARVLRDGVEKEVDTHELVPGDIIILDEGGKVPADSRLFEAISLECEESALTGESVPSRKEAAVVLKKEQAVAERENMVFLGTVVTHGRAKAIVVETGMNTQVGRIAELVQEVEEEQTPLQRKLEVLGKQLGTAALVAVVIIFLVGVGLRGGNLFEMFLIAVSLAVAAIPEGLPAVVTVTLAIGVQRMAKRNAIIRKLTAVETLGAATVICTDKTGTLTKNEMTVREVFADGKRFEVAGRGYGLTGEFTLNGKRVSALKDEALFLLLKTGVLCNNASLAISSDKKNSSVLGDPTEGSLVVLGWKAGLDFEELREEHEFVSEIPFDSSRKMMSVLRKDGGKTVSFVKGAPEAVLAKCAKILKDGKEIVLSEKDRKEIFDENKRMASQALRVLAFAFKKNAVEKNAESDLVFLGLVGMMDPPRPEAKTAVEACNAAGIRVIMITGDNRDTAIAVGKELGILRDGLEVLTGAELDEASDEEIDTIIEKTAIYARVSPEHKLRIVNALKRKGEIVAMTGDGVNDAPAIKRADIGVGMGITGTDVTKEASDMIATDDNFASIVNAVEEGRIVFDNIMKSVKYLVSCNIGELLAVFTAIIGGLATPLVPIQILWMNMVTDSAPALALGLEQAEPGVMQRKPRDAT